MCGELCWTFEANFGLTSLLDILVVTVIFFLISFLLRGTQAVTLLRGVLILVLIVGLAAAVFPLVAFRWLFGNLVTAAAIAIPVIFQPELRRFLERLGRAGLRIGQRQVDPLQRAKLIEDVFQAATRLSERRQGALIVLEREGSLQEYIDTGIHMDSESSAQLLLTIFWPKTELHDGAVIIRNNKIAAGACVLPLSSGRNLSDRKLGTRHRAALGISEISDAVCVVVSEETGQISVANAGRLIRKIESQRLRSILTSLYGETRQQRLTISTIAGRIRRLFNAAAS